MQKHREPYLSKDQVHYRLGTSHHCRDCVMFHGSLLGTGRCDLVTGVINPAYQCDRWEAKP